MPHQLLRRDSERVVTPQPSPTPADRHNLAAYLLGGGKALAPDVGLAHLARAFGSRVRTLISKHRQVQRGRSARRNTAESAALLNALGRREFMRTMTTGVLLGVGGADRLLTLLPPADKNLLEWILTVRRTGRVLPASRDLLSLQAWEGYVFDWIDAEMLEQLGKRLCEHPQLFLTNTLVQQLWTYALGEYGWMTSGPNIAGEVATRLANPLRQDSCRLML